MYKNISHYINKNKRANSYGMVEWLAQRPKVAGSIPETTDILNNSSGQATNALVYLFTKQCKLVPAGWGWDTVNISENLWNLFFIRWRPRWPQKIGIWFIFVWWLDVKAQSDDFQCQGLASFNLTIQLDH